VRRRAAEEKSWLAQVFVEVDNQNVAFNRVAPRTAVGVMDRLGDE